MPLVISLTKAACITPPCFFLANHWMSDEKHPVINRSRKGRYFSLILENEAFDSCRIIC